MIGNVYEKERRIATHESSAPAENGQRKARVQPPL